MGVCLSVCMYMYLFVCVSGFQEKYEPQLTRHDHLLAFRQHDPACSIPCVEHDGHVFVCVCLCMCLSICLFMYQNFQRYMKPNSPGITISMPSGSTILAAASHV